MPFSYKHLFLMVAGASLLLTFPFRLVAAAPPPVSSAEARSSSIKTSGDGKSGSKYLLTLPAASENGNGLATGSITFVGNATVIIRYGGLTILTDPNFLHRGDHVHLGYGLTSEH